MARRAVSALRGVGNADVGCQDHRALGTGQDRVELHQHDLRVVVLEPGQPGREILERGGVDGGQALVAEEFAGGAGCADEVVDVRVGERRNPVRPVIEQVDRVAGEPEGHHRAQQRVLDGAERAGLPHRGHRLHLQGWRAVALQ